MGIYNTRIKLHYMSEGSYGDGKAAEILLDGKVVAEARTDIVFDKENKKTALDILADQLTERIPDSLKFQIGRNNILEALKWGANCSLDCQVFVI